MAAFNTWIAAGVDVPLGMQVETVWGEMLAKNGPVAMYYSGDAYRRGL